MGCKVKIYNARFDSWFSGDIVSYDPIKRLHLVCALVVKMFSEFWSDELTLPVKLSFAWLLSSGYIFDV